MLNITIVLLSILNLLLIFQKQILQAIFIKNRKEVFKIAYI